MEKNKKKDKATYSIAEFTRNKKDKDKGVNSPLSIEHQKGCQCAYCVMTD